MFSYGKKNKIDFTKLDGVVRINQDVCKNGYPFCYGWKNLSMPFTTNLIGSSVYMDCRGELYGKASLDECGICDGKGPQYFCEKTEKTCNIKADEERKIIQGLGTFTNWKIVSDACTQEHLG